MIMLYMCARDQLGLTSCQTVAVNVTEAAVSLVDLTDASDLLEATILAGDVEATTTLALMQAQRLNAASSTSVVSEAAQEEMASGLTTTLVSVLSSEGGGEVNVMAVMEGLKQTTRNKVSNEAADAVLSGLSSATTILQQQFSAGGSVSAEQLGSVLSVYSQTLASRYLNRTAASNRTTSNAKEVKAKVDESMTRMAAIIADSMAAGERDISSFSGGEGAAIGFTTKKDFSDRIKPENPVTAVMPTTAESTRRRSLLQTSSADPVLRMPSEFAAACAAAPNICADPVTLTFQYSENPALYTTALGGEEGLLQNLPAGSTDPKIISGVTNAASSTLKFAARIGGKLEVDMPVNKMLQKDGQTTQCMRLDSETGYLTDSEMETTMKSADMATCLSDRLGEFVVLAFTPLPLRP